MISAISGSGRSSIEQVFRVLNSNDRFEARLRKGGGVFSTNGGGRRDEERRQVVNWRRMEAEAEAPLAFNGIDPQTPPASDSEL